MPSVGDVEVVVGNRCVSADRGQRRIQSRGCLPNWHRYWLPAWRSRSHSRYRQDGDSSCGCQTSDSIETSVSDVAARGIAANLIGGREVDAGSIIGALVVVEVVLVLAAELDKVIALQLGQVIAEEVILAVPDTGADVLCIDVVRRENDRGALAERFNRASSACNLSRSVSALPLPEVAQVAVVEVVGEGGS